MLKHTKIYYQALIDRNSEYEGVFFVGVKSTGVFCRPTCTARKPKFENCEFFETAEQSLLASYRPCKRCQPLSHPQQVSPLVQKLVAAVENEPEKRWTNADFQEISVDASTARRQFQKRFGMTFVEYARARRMGLAMQQIRAGEPIIEAQLASGYESGSGFRDAFSRIMGAAPSKSGQSQVLKASWIDTPLGPMMIVADEKLIYVLEFIDRRGLEREIERLRLRTKSAIIPGQTEASRALEVELRLYFDGKLAEFQTPLFLLGSDFQKHVWEELKKIPLGETRSYLELARAVKRPQAFRAVAQANGANQIAIVIPCHRVINASGAIGGYGGGLSRKRWLLDHEVQMRLKGVGGKIRCFGGQAGKEFYADYHDQEWGIPEHNDEKLFEMLILEGAQAGLSWETILKKREGYRKAFHEFDPKKVAAMSDRDLEVLCKDPAIIRNRLKIFGARQNALAFLKIQKEFGSFERYVWDFVGGKPIINHRQSLKEIPATTPVSDALSKDLKKRGMTFVGSTIIYSFMQAVGLVNDHIKSCWRCTLVHPQNP